MNGIEAARIIKRETPTVKVIILSMHNDRLYLREAFSVGAEAFILKDSAFSEITQAIKAVKRGNRFFSKNSTEMLLKDLQVASLSETAGLTKREKEILHLIATGKSGRDIAETLKISYKTLDCHRQALKKKLKAQTLTELTRVALEMQLSEIRS